MPDYPDYTKPITITGITIETLPIDIVAQTVGNIAIDIAAQSLGEINVNIAASAVTLNVDITAQTLEALNINITGGLSDIRLGKIVNPDFEEGETGWVFREGAVVDDWKAKTGLWSVKFPKGSAGSVEQFGITPPIPTDKIASFKFSEFITHPEDMVIVTVYYSDGTYDDTEPTPTKFAQWETFDITFTPGKHIVGVYCAYPGIAAHEDLWVDGFYIAFSVDQYASIVSSVQLDINIAASAVTLNVAIQSSAVTLNVNLESQTVDINIKTSGGVNLVIDKLTQTAYVEDRRTLSNKGTTPTWNYVIGTGRIGKFFPRGCRGFINTIDVYCKDAAAAGGTITVYISPHPSMGYIATADVTVDAEQPAQWKSATFNRMWNYDSMFIFVVCSSTLVQFGIDTVENPDQYISTDGGATWTAQDSRPWFRVVMKAMTVGDLPVSGTLNTIQIPHASDERLYVEGTVGTSTTTVKDVYGAGVTQQLLFRFDAADASHTSDILLYCDGKLVFFWGINLLSAAGYNATTPCIQLLKYAENGFCSVQVDIKFEFQRHFRIRINAGAADTGYKVEGVVNLIK